MKVWRPLSAVLADNKVRELCAKPEREPWGSLSGCRSLVCNQDTAQLGIELWNQGRNHCGDFIVPDGR